MDQILSTLTQDEFDEFCMEYAERGDPGFFNYLVAMGFEETGAVEVAFTAQFRC